jgi:hypothetical protein
MCTRAESFRACALALLFEPKIFLLLPSSLCTLGFRALIFPPCFPLFRLKKERKSASIKGLGAHAQLCCQLIYYLQLSMLTTRIYGFLYGNDDIYIQLQRHCFLRWGSIETLGFAAWTKYPPREVSRDMPWSTESIIVDRSLKERQNFVFTDGHKL